MLALARSARLVSWGNGAIAGRVSPDTAAERITGQDVVHRVFGLVSRLDRDLARDATGALRGRGDGPPAEEDEPTSLPLALARLRTSAVTGLRLVLPAPGDPGPLPGPPAVNALAVEAGEAVLTVGGPALALLPRVEAYFGPDGRGLRVDWQVHPVHGVDPVRRPDQAQSLDATGWSATVGPGSPSSLAEAERALKEALREATVVLASMGEGSWRPQYTAALEELRTDRAMVDALAPGYPSRAASVLALARQVGGIAALAEGQDGSPANGAAQADRRAAVLRGLATVSRQAQMAAYNAVLEPTIH